MSLEKAILRVGSKVWFNGQHQTVAAMSALTVTLRSLRTAEQTIVSCAELLTADGFSLSPTEEKLDSSPEALKHPFTGIVEEAEEKKARELLSHLLEAITGYKTGTDEDPGPGEPKPQYDPDRVNLTRRMTCKARELGVSERAMWKYKSDYQAFGLYGLLDRRAARLTAVGPSPIVTQAIDRTVHELRDKSNQTFKRTIAMVVAAIKATKGLPDDFEMPSDVTLRRYLLDREDARQLLKSAKGRRNAANRPTHAYTRFYATRPGEVVLIDSTPLDAFALDPRTYQPISVKLTIAIDLYTRSLVGWRFSESEKAIDAALLLADIVSPKRSREFFGESVAKPFVGIPKSIVTRLQADDKENERVGRLVPVPFLHPESILVDQGRVFLSDTFLMASAQLGINVMLARPYTPTDKAQVERMFKTIRESFVEGLPGYKGPNVEARGKKPENDAFYFIHEIDEYFRQWVSSYWQERTHDGLFLPVVPTLELTPNQMLAEGIARAGFMHVLPSKDMYYQLMPLVRRKIHHYGVDLDLLRYDSSALDSFRNVIPPYANSEDGKWPFRQDPRDKSVLFFFDVETKEWVEIPWIGSKGRRPFDDKLLQLAKKIIFERTGDAPTRGDMNVVLNELLDRMANVPAKTRADRKRLAETIERDRKAQARQNRRASGKDSGKGNRQGDLLPSESDMSPATWSVRAIPSHIEVYSHDVDNDADGIGDDMEGVLAAVSGDAFATVKPVDEAFEDADDDLQY